MEADLGTARREKITTAVDRGARSFPSTTFAVPKPSSQNEATSSWLSSESFESLIINYTLTQH